MNEEIYDSIVVHPDYQKNGIGKEIMNILVEYLNQYAPDKAFIGLFASQGSESFDKKYDLKDDSPNMTGMFTVISKNKYNRFLIVGEEGCSLIRIGLVIMMIISLCKSFCYAFSIAPVA